MDKLMHNIKKPNAKKGLKVVLSSVIQPVVHESLLVHESLYNGT